MGGEQDPVRPVVTEAEATAWSAPPWLCPFLVVVALAGRVVFSASGGVFVDEAWTYFLACGSLVDIIAGARPDLNTPTYSVLLHALLSVTGPSVREPLLLRLPSLLCGAAVVPVVFLIGRRVHGDAVAAWAAGLVAVAYACLLTDSQIRPYGLLSLLSVVALWGRLEAEDRGAPRGGWALYGVACCLLTLNHYLGALVVAGLLLGALPSRRRWPLVASLLPALIACVAWVVYSVTGPIHSDVGSRVLGSRAGLTLQAFHTPGFLLGLLIPVQWPPAWIALGMTPTVLYWLTMATDLGAWIAFGFGLQAVARRDRMHGVVMALFVLLPLLGLTVGASLGLQPYQHRYAVGISGAWFVLVVAGLLRWRAGLLLALVVAANLVVMALFPFQSFFWNQDWKSTVDFVEERQQAGDVLLVYVPYSLVGFNFYCQGRQVGADFSRPGAIAFRYPSGSGGIEQMGFTVPLLGPGLEQRLGQRRVFLVLSQEDAIGGQAIRDWFGARYGMVDGLEQRSLHTWGNASTYLLVPRPREVAPASPVRGP